MRCVKAELIYTGTGLVKDAFVILNDAKVAGISSEMQGELINECKVITPAFIDPHSHIGMIRAGEPAAESESNDKQDTFLVLADALDSLQMDDQSLKDAVEAGVLYSCILPGSGNIIGGKSAVIRNYARDSSRAFIADAGIKAAFGYNPMSTTSWSGSRPTTRMGALAMLRKKFDEVVRKEKRYRDADEEKRKEIDFSAEEEVLLQVLRGETILRVHVHKIDDIATLLRLVDEFSVRVSVEHAMDVNKTHIFQELSGRGIPVIYGPVDAFAYKVELKHEHWRNIKHLLESGVEFALMSDHPVTPARQLLLQTRWFLRSGCTKEEAIEMITRRPAKLLGLDDRMGTLEQGRWASFVCWNGDPFDLASYPAAVFGEGEMLFQED